MKTKKPYQPPRFIIIPIDAPTCFICTSKDKLGIHDEVSHQEQLGIDPPVYLDDEPDENTKNPLAGDF